MAAVTIRNLPDDTHRALKVRAARNGRSTEAEIRAILEQVTQPARRGVGTALVELGRRFGGVEIPDVRDRSPVTPIDLE